MNQSEKKLLEIYICRKTSSQKRNRDRDLSDASASPSVCFCPSKSNRMCLIVLWRPYRSNFCLVLDGRGGWGVSRLYDGATKKKRRREEEKSGRGGYVGRMAVWIPCLLYSAWRMPVI